MPRLLRDCGLILVAKAGVDGGIEPRVLGHFYLFFSCCAIVLRTFSSVIFNDFAMIVRGQYDALLLIAKNYAEGYIVLNVSEFHKVI